MARSVRRRDVHHAQQQRHDSSSSSGLQRLQDRPWNRPDSEVDQRLRRDFRRVRLLELLEQHRQRPLVRRPAEEPEDELFTSRFGVAWRCSIERRRSSRAGTTRGTCAGSVAAPRLHHARLLRLGDPHQRAQRGEVQLLLVGDDPEEEADRADVGDLADRLQHRLAQRFLRIQRQDRRRRCGRRSRRAPRRRGTSARGRAIAGSPEGAQSM